KEARLVIRASGTEPVIRIMAEGDEREVLNAVGTELTDVVSAMMCFQGEGILKGLVLRFAIVLCSSLLKKSEKTLQEMTAKQCFLENMFIILSHRQG
ncbi:hypothetical protein HNQ69_001580, partial [Bartonella callosciuri]